MSRAATGCSNRTPSRRCGEITATVAWLDDEPLVAGRVYWALQGHRWVKAKVARIVDRVNITTLASEPADRLEANAIGDVVLALQQPLAVLPFARSRTLGSLVLVGHGQPPHGGRGAGHRLKCRVSPHRRLRIPTP